MTDWPALLPDAARRLLGEPSVTEHGGDTWRYGTHGSLAVHVGGDRRGTWHDFEADESGGTLALVRYRLQADKPGALAWLADAGLIDPPAGNGSRKGSPALPPAPALAPAPVPAPASRSRTADTAAAIIEAAVPGDGTATREYLALRGTWPRADVHRAPALPVSVLWLPAGKVERLRMPDGAAGCAVYLLTDPLGELPPAVKLEALTANGMRPDWTGGKRWRRNYGSSRGLVFETRNVPGGALWLAEGEADALALTVAGHGGCVRAVVGAGGYAETAAHDPQGRPVALVPDPGTPGEAGILRLLVGLPGRTVAAPIPRPDGDPADWLGAWLAERSGIRQYDAVQDRATATADAWGDLLCAVAGGERLLAPVSYRWRDFNGAGAVAGDRAAPERQSPAPAPAQA